MLVDHAGLAAGHAVQFRRLARGMPGVSLRGARAAAMGLIAGVRNAPDAWRKPKRDAQAGLFKNSPCGKACATVSDSGRNPVKHAWWLLATMGGHHRVRFERLPSVGSHRRGRWSTDATQNR